jgi:hypothetical protein
LPDILSNILFANTPNLHSALGVRDFVWYPHKRTHIALFLFYGNINNNYMNPVRLDLCITVHLCDVLHKMQGTECWIWGRRTVNVAL